MSFFFSTHSSVNVDVVVGDDTALGPILQVGGRKFVIPEQVLESLLEVQGFKNASQQEQVKAFLFEMLSLASK
jgi:hypothetical protein